MGSFSPKGVEDKNFRMSCQFPAAKSPKKKAIIKPAITATFFAIRLSKLIGLPTKLAGREIIQGIFEAVAMRKFIKRKRREKVKTATKITILLPNDFMKTSVNPTSPNHHQSVTNPIRFEKRIKMTKNTPNNNFLDIFTAFIVNKKPAFCLGRL